MQLYTQNIMHVHAESALPGVSTLMPSSVPSSPAKLFMESKEKTEIQKWEKKKPTPNPTTTENVGTEKQADEEKASLVSQLLPKQNAMGTFCYS